MTEPHFNPTVLSEHSPSPTAAGPQSDKLANHGSRVSRTKAALIPAIEKIESVKLPTSKMPLNSGPRFEEADKEVKTKASTAIDSQADVIIALAKVQAILSQRGKEKMRREAGIKLTTAAIYHRLLPKEGGVVWDMSAGFGGRLLGALACDRVDRYIGTDPSTHAMEGLREMVEELVPMAAQFGRRSLDVELHQMGSEDFVPERNSLDVAFTSPPFGPGWEKYSEEPTQSYKKFPTQQEWLHGYIGATLRNCARGLKRNGVLAINIASVAAFPNLAKVFVRFAEDNGWRLIETLHLQLSKMVGLKHIGRSPFKTEPIFVFRKR